MALQSPIGVISFPHLFKARPQQEGKDPRFSLSLLFDKNAQNSPEFKKMKTEVLECARAKWGADADEMIKNGQIRMPFRKGSEKSKYAGYTDDIVFVNAWSTQKPDVLDGRLNDVIESDTYPGMMGRITYGPFAWEASGAKGVSIGLNNVQISDFQTPRLDGKAAGRDEFDSIDSDSAAPSDDDDEMPF